MSINTSSVDLSNCENEKLHLSGAIQHVGALLAVDHNFLITHASANVVEFLGVESVALLGNELPADLKMLFVSSKKAGSTWVFTKAIERNNVHMDVVASSLSNDHLLIEITRSIFSDNDENKLVKKLLMRVDLDRQLLVEDILRITGAERVMYYQFHEDFHGEVLNEACSSPSLGSYLGLHFPASDIPKIARDMYINNPWRLISDAQSESVPIMSHTNEALDLSFSMLRSASPVHCVYLANMGVRGSLSFACMVAKSLDALITVHHSQPLLISPDVLMSVSTKVKSYALLLANEKARERIRYVDTIQVRLNPLREMLQRHGSIVSAWDEITPFIMKEFDVDGVMLCSDDYVVAHGTVLGEEALDHLDNYVVNQSGENIWFIDSLFYKFPDFPVSNIAGVCAFKLIGHDFRIYLTRIEFPQQISWGGNPNKPVEYVQGTAMIAPRQSFSTWIEDRLGYSRPWDVKSRIIGLKLLSVLNEYC